MLAWLSTELLRLRLLLLRCGEDEALEVTEEREMVVRVSPVVVVMEAALLVDVGPLLSPFCTPSRSR